MSVLLDLAAGIFLAVQSAPQPVGDRAATADREPVAVVVSATARVLRPAIIDKGRLERERDTDAARATRARQRRVDAAGTVWIEFS